MSNANLNNISRNILCTSLTEQLHAEYNNILNFQNLYNKSMEDIASIMTNHAQSPHITKLHEYLNKNLTDYIPQLDVKLTPDQEFFQSIEKQIINTNLLDIPNNRVCNILNISTLEDLQNLTEIPSSFVDSYASIIKECSLKNVVSSIPTMEMAAGAAFAALDENFNISNITNSVDKVLDLSKAISSDFGDLVNIGEINAMITDLPNMLDDMSMKLDGMLDISKMQEKLTDMIPDVGALTDQAFGQIMEIKDTMNMMLHDINGQIMDKIDGFLDCGCASGIGGILGGNFLNDTLDKLFDNALMDSLNKFGDTFDNIMGDVNGFIDDAMGPINNLTDSLKDGVGGLIDGAMGGLDSMMGQVDNLLGEGMSFVNNLSDNLPIDKLTEMIPNGLSELQKLTELPLAGIESVAGLVEKLPNGLNDVLSVIPDGLDGIVNAIPGEFEGFVNEVIGGTNNFIELLGGNEMAPFNLAGSLNSGFNSLFENTPVAVQLYDDGEGNLKTLAEINYNINNIININMNL